MMLHLLSWCGALNEEPEAPKWMRAESGHSCVEDMDEIRERYNIRREMGHGSSGTADTRDNLLAAHTHSTVPTVIEACHQEGHKLS